MKRQGISLITLVITIVIIIILAGTVILNLSDNNPINSAKKANVFQDIDTFKTELTLKLTTGYTNGIFDLDNINAVTKEDILKYIPSMENEKIGKTLYTDILVITEGTLAVDGTKANEWVTNGKLKQEEYEWLLEAIGNNVFNEQIYSIKYYTNDGTENFTESSKIHNVPYSILPAEITRDGYGFKGWNTAADGTGDTYNAGDEYLDNAELTLYAQWEAGTYTVTYYKNDGTEEAKTDLKTQDVPYEIADQSFTREGYTFAGYNTSKDGTGTDYAVGASYAENTELELYAKWEIITYSITYYANDGTNKSITDTKNHGDTYIVKNQNYVKDGYTFVCYNTSKDGNGIDYEVNASYVDNANLELYAKWELNKYDITYYANDGTDISLVDKKVHNVTYTIENKGYTKDGYTFDGWNTNADGTGTTYAVGASYTINEPLELYAKWKINTYNITYHKNDGTNTILTSEKTYNETYTIENKGYTKDGYTFNGWNTKADGTGTDYAVGSSYTANTSLDLYAKWKVNTYTVTYNANSGINAPSAQTKTHGVALTLSTSVPTRSGYTFDGWNTNAEGTGTNYAKGASYTTNENLTLYAKWNRVTYTVTYNANNGTNAPASQTKTYGVTLTLSTSVPTRSGYTFDGWNTKSDGTGINYAKGSNYTTNDNLTLYAKWKVNGVSAAEVKSNASKYYGAYVNYTPSNGYTGKWRVFLADNTRIYLIAEDYVLNSYLTATGLTNSMNSANNLKDYCVYSSKNRQDLVTKLTTSSYYTGFKDSTEYANSVVGAATLEQFVASYNDTNPSKKLYIHNHSAASEKYGGYTSKSPGYSLSFSETTGYSYVQSIANCTKADLYIRTSTTNAYGMWLASFSTDSAYSHNVMGVWYSGGVGGNDYSNNKFGLRPIVTLNSGVKLVDPDGDGVYDLE